MCVRACEREAEEAEKKKGGREEEVRTKKTPIDFDGPALKLFFFPRSPNSSL